MIFQYNFNMSYQNNKKGTNIAYFLGFLLMVYIVIFIFCDTYLIPLHKVSGPAGEGLTPGTEPGIAQIYSFWDPWNELSIIFYFTVHSNIFVLIYMFLRACRLIDPRKNIHAKRFQMIVGVNIFVTFLVYWTILAPVDVIWFTPLKVLDNIQMHFVTALVFLVTFIFETSRNKRNSENIKLKNKDCWYALIYPIIWLLIAIILYYATRKTQSWIFKYNDNTWSKPIAYTFGIAIYPFLAFDIVPVWLPILSILAIIILIIFVSYLLIKASHHNSWIYKVIDWWKKILHLN